MYLKTCIVVALVFVLNIVHTNSSSAAVNSFEALLENFDSDLNDDGLQQHNIAKRTVVFRPLFVYRQQQAKLVNNPQHTAVHQNHAGHHDGGGRHMTKRAVVFRPLFVYRQQQAKLIQKQKSTIKCIETLKGMGHTAPYQPHFHKCKKQPTSATA